MDILYLDTMDSSLRQKGRVVEMATCCNIRNKGLLTHIWMDQEALRGQEVGLA